ncbi:MAG: hypothetical protein WC022_00910 [Parcubacteria group bacterium]
MILVKISGLSGYYVRGDDSRFFTLTKDKPYVKELIVTNYYNKENGDNKGSENVIEIYFEKTSTDACYELLSDLQGNFTDYSIIAIEAATIIPCKKKN